jgi:ubiquinone/menaquinone biosynthesis C-methylase UbiE
MINYNQEPIKQHSFNGHPISDFINIESEGNIDKETVESFGEEWTKFSSFDTAEIERMGNEYFDVLHHSSVDKNSYVLDMGCGTGRWSYYLSPKVKFIEAIDPSNAVFSAASLTSGKSNIRITKAGVDNIPFADNSFDFIFSLGVLHHLPDTTGAIKKIYQKIKPGGYFLVYLYYNLDNRGAAYKIIFKLSNIVRRVISSMPKVLKQLMAEIISFAVYLPFVFLARICKALFPRREWYKKIPLSYYHNKSLTIIRNDALDRFGTPLEKRFSRVEIEKMLTDGGFSNIIFSEKTPYWHCIAQKIV